MTDLAVSVVIPTYRRPDRLAPLVDALTAQTLDADHFEVIVVDDASEDDSFTKLQRLSKVAPFRLRPVRQLVNRGPAAARNAGWRVAEASVIAFLDDDCLPHPGWLKAVIGSFVAREHVGVVQGHTIVPPDVILSSLPPWSLWRSVTKAGPFFEGCNIFYRKEALEQAGGFSESIGWWGEDTALGWSVLEAGWGRGFAPDAMATHEVEPRGWWWHMKNGYAERNVVRLAAEHPGFRAEAFWRPWAFRRVDAATFLATVSLLVALRWRPALAGAIPYVVLRRPSLREPLRPLLIAQVASVDSARCAGQVTGALLHRVAVI